MVDVSFSDFMAGLPSDTLGGAEAIPLMDGVTIRKVTAPVLAAFVVDQLHQASVVTSVGDSDEIVLFQSDVEKVITASNFFSWVVDKLEAVAAGSTIVSGDKLLFIDGGVLKQIDIDDVKSFLDTQGSSIGSQINALSSATLADNDQYVVAQGSTGAKTTFSAIAARVHAQFLAYMTGLTAVTTLANGDEFYVNDNGVPAKVTAEKLSEYISAKIGPDIVADSWDEYTAVGGPAAGTDEFLIQRSATGRTLTGANIASYVIATQDAASDAIAGAAGDDFIIFRSGVQQKIDIGLVSSYVINSAWSLASGSPVVTADKVVIGRGGSSYSVTVDQLADFILDGVQEEVLDWSGLDAATLASESAFLIGTGSTAEKTTLGDLETKLWTDYQVYVSGLSALTGLAGSDVFYVVDSGIPKKITATSIYDFIESQIWDKSDATPAVQSGDDIYMRRSGASYTLSVDELSSFIATAAASNFNISALGDATLSDADVFIVDEGASNTKVTVANLRSHLWTSFVSYVTGLADGGTAEDDHILYVIDTGAPTKLTVAQLWDTRFVDDAKAIKLDDFATPDDNTDLNASASRHGLLPKLSNNARQFLRGDGAWATYSSVTANAVAATGSVFGDAALLPATNVSFITSDNAAKGVALPSGAAGDIIDVINSSSTAAKLYPASGGTINGLATNAAVVIPASKGVRCFCSAANTWTAFDMTAKAATA